jgi:hypothetical protein
VTTDTTTTKTSAAPAPFSPGTARQLMAVERAAYGAAGLVAAVGPQMGPGWLHTGAITLGVGALGHLWTRTRNQDQGLDAGRLLTTCARTLPVLGLSGCYTAALANPGTTWWEWAAPLGVAALAGLAAPLTRGRALRHTAENLPARIEAQGAALAAGRPADPYTDGVTHMWEASRATGDTTLTDLHQLADDAPDFTAVILAPPGEAIPASLDERAVAGVYDVPEEAVHLAPVDGAGPGRLVLTVAPTIPAAQGMTPDQIVERMWAEKIAARGGVAPGMNLAAHRLEDDRLVVRVEAEDSKMIRLPRVPIARALGVADPELVMVETDGMATGVVTIYRQHPLITIPEATPADLTMDASGRIVLGLRHDGRPARWPLWNPELGAVTDLIVGASGSGKSVTLNTVLAAERISGVVSIVADAQDGMSLPEANGRTAHFGAGIAAVGATLAAVCAVADYRQDISSSRGWGAFQLGDPWPLVNTTLDEINLVLGADAEVPKEFRTWVTGMIARVQHTGRKMGMGIRLAGQSIHVADLGDAEKIRAGAKRGSVWLGRVDSSLTAGMASSMVSDGTEITPVPANFGSAAAEVEAAWTGTETPLGPVTAGCAWLLQGGKAVNMRTFRAIKHGRTFPGLIRLYEAAPVPRLTPEEEAVFRQAYTEALDAAELLLAGEDPYGGDDQDDLADPGDIPGVEQVRERPAARAFIPPPPRTLADRVLDALASGPLRIRDIRAAVGVGEPDGPAAGSVDNTLSKLAEAGRVERTGHGVWALPGQTDPTP